MAAVEESAAAPAGQTGNVVIAKDVTRVYGEGATAVEALRGVSLDVRSGQLVAVMGPSGSGKSTLMHILAGLDKPTGGTVTIAGTEITGLNDANLTKLRREHIGFVFQFFNLLPMLTAEENVVLPLSIAGEKPDKEWLDELMSKTGLTERGSHRPSELSGGQQQRVAIARALVTRPTILFADEPTGNLDSKTGGEILELLRDSSASYGQTIVMVTHEPRAAAIADRVLFIADGLIVKELTDTTSAQVLEVMSTLQVVTTVALKGLLGRKLRAALTAVAIVLGVAMVSGTYVLTDTITAAFNTLFTQVYQNTDAVITGKSAIGTSNTAQGGQIVPSFPQSLLTQVRGLPGVLEAEGGIDDQSQLVGRNNKVIATRGPGLAFSVNPAGNQRFNPLVLTSGRWPSAPREIAIDKATASSKHFALGDTIGVVARGPVQTFRIVGLVKFGGLNSLGGATLSIFDLPTAQRLFHKQGRLDSIGVAGKPNVTPQELVRQIRPVLPATAQVRTGQAQAAKQSSDTSGFLDILRYFLLAFGGVALFVGAFVIANTLSITIAQRTRELATLRTLGATRRQVLTSVMLEAFIIGLLASIVGLFLGLGLAKGLNALFISFGIDLPQAGTVFATRTIVVSLLVGVLVTLIAASRPAIRATRVPPISAVREGAVLPKSRFARFGPVVATAVILGAFALMLIGLFVGGLSTKARLLSLGVGAAAVFIGVAMLAPTLVPPLARVIGWPAARLGGAAGKLARGNAVRNPSRTASTAAALMIGLALVTLVAVLAAGLKSTFESAVNEVFRADYALTSQDGFSPISIASANALRTTPGVTVVSGVRAGQGRAFGSRIGLTGVAPDISRVIDVNWYRGSQLTPATLGSSGAFVSKDYAKSHHLVVGSPVVVELTTGEKLHLKLHGIFAPPKGGSPYGDVTISTQLFDHVIQNPQNVFTFVNMRGGVTPANTARLNAALKDFPDAKIQTESQFKANQLQGIDTLLRLLYVLLSLSIIVSLFGIVNTLVLTVFERTRELGMLRAVGMTRVQVRRMIRAESVITALLGAALGIPVGIVLALMVGRAIKYPAFTIPVGTIVVFVIAAIFVGLVAAIFPARRAGKLNVLEALQYE